MKKPCDFSKLIPKVDAKLRDRLHHKYIVSKANGEPVDPRAEYFLLRVDIHGEDARLINAARRAVLLFADKVKSFLPNLSADIRKRYDKEVVDKIRPKRKRKT